MTKKNFASGRDYCRYIHDALEARKDPRLNVVIPVPILTGGRRPHITRTGNMTIGSSKKGASFAFNHAIAILHWYRHDAKQQFARGKPLRRGGTSRLKVRRVEWMKFRDYLLAPY